MNEPDELRKKIQTAFKNWEENIYKKTISQTPEQKKKFTTQSFTPVKPLYVPSENELENYNEKLGFPGQYPFTRGVQPSMYRGRFWTMRQYAGFGSAKESNERYRYLLSQGQSGLSVAFDLPTQIGYDSDDPMALGEVGKVGVAIDTLADMEILFDQFGKFKHLVNSISFEIAIHFIRHIIKANIHRVDVFIVFKLCLP